MVDARRVAHHRQSVAILQTEVVGSQQSDITTQHSAHIHAIGIAHLQASQSLAVESRTGHHDDSALQFGIDGIPVHLIIIPLLIHLLSEENLHGRSLILIGNHEHIIVGMEHGISLRNDDLLASPYTGNDELAMGHHRDFGDGTAVESRVYDDVLSDGCMVILIGTSDLQVLRLHEDLAQEHHRQDDAHNAQRIGYRTAQSCSAARQSQLLQRLLGSTQSRSIGGGTAENAHHIGQAHGQHQAQGKREYGAHGDDSQAPEIERDALVAHRTEEVGTYIETQHIHEHGESEALGKLQHVLVDGESEMARHDAHKEYESYAEGDSLDMNLAQGKT